MSENEPVFARASQLRTGDHIYVPFADKIFIVTESRRRWFRARNKETSEVMIIHFNRHGDGDEPEWQVVTNDR